MIILYDYVKLSILVTEMLCSIYTKFTTVTSNVVHPMYNTFSTLSMSTTLVYVNYIPRRKSGIYWIQVRRAAAAAAVEISLWTR